MISGTASHYKIKKKIITVHIFRVGHSEKAELYSARDHAGYFGAPPPPPYRLSCTIIHPWLKRSIRGLAIDL